MRSKKAVVGRRSPPGPSRLSYSSAAIAGPKTETAGPRLISSMMQQCSASSEPARARWRGRGCLRNSEGRRAASPRGRRAPRGREGSRRTSCSGERRSQRPSWPAVRGSAATRRRPRGGPGVGLGPAGRSWHRRTTRTPPALRAGAGFFPVAGAPATSTLPFCSSRRRTARASSGRHWPRGHLGRPFFDFLTVMYRLPVVQSSQPRAEVLFGASSERVDDRLGDPRVPGGRRCEASARRRNGQSVFRRHPG